MKYKYNHKFFIMLSTGGNSIFCTIRTSTPFVNLDVSLLSMLNLIFREQLGNNSYCMMILKHIVTENK